MTHLKIPAATTLDPPVRALQARWSASWSMESLYMAFADWLLHIMRSPGKRLDLLQMSLEQAQQLQAYLLKCAMHGDDAISPCAKLPASDSRFVELVKQFTFLADAESAGIVMGAQVPIILTSHADAPRARIASCAVAVLMAQAAKAPAMVMAES